MPGKVFISCGQRDNERTIALEVQRILEDEFSLNTYLAFQIMGLDDIMTITNELKLSDYYLFIDFLRRPKSPEDFSISLFTHQELALAHNIGFKDMIALQQTGVKLEGFIRYILSNPDEFVDENDLYDKVRKLVKDKKWSNTFSRNLVLSSIEFSEPIQYADHIGTSIEKVCKIKVHNMRPDRAAVETVCILDYIVRPDGSQFNSPDRSYLKWAWQMGYTKTILPMDFGEIDLFSIRLNQPGIFLHSARDFVRDPIVIENGQYYFSYKLFSHGFPFLQFGVSIDLQWMLSQPLNWNFRSSAKIF